MSMFDEESGQRQRINWKSIYIYIFDYYNYFIQENMQERQSDLIEPTILFNYVQLFLKELMQIKSHQILSKNYHKISRQLIYFIKLQEKKLCQINQLNSLLEKVYLLLKTSEYQKYGHNFPLFAQLLKRYSKLLNQKANYCFSKKQQLEIIFKKDESQYYQESHATDISVLNKKFQNCTEISNFLIKLTLNKIIIQNSQCICCSQVFQKKSIITNMKSNFSVLKGIISKKDLESVVLKKYFNAICNIGGGILLIGCRSVGINSVVVEGLAFENKEQLLNVQKQIKLAIDCLRPFCFAEIRKVSVYEGLYSYKEDKNHQLIVLRICIIPLISWKLSYLEKTLSNCHKIYQFYKFSQTYELIQISSKVTYQDVISLYTFILEKYKSKQISRNAHKYIKCYEPCQNFAHESNSQHYLSLSSVSYPINEYKENNSIEQIPFVHKNASLLIVCNKHNDRYINQFELFLKDYKIKHKFSQPFANYFNEGMRSIWVLDHGINFLKVKTYLKQCELKMHWKSKHVIFMPVLQRLEVQKSKLLNEGLNLVKAKFYRFRNQNIEYRQTKIIENNSEKLVYIFELKSKSEAILAYMILQQLGVRPYFFRDFPGTSATVDY